MSALFDFPSLLVVILLFICSSAFARSLYPNIFGQPAPSSNIGLDVNISNNSINKRNGFYDIAWKASRIGERLSPYIAAACIVMAVHVLFLT
jgi:hypothetical protein